MRSYLALALALGAVACRAPDGGDDQPATDGNTPTIDAMEGVGCSPRSPRMVEPQAFVGPTGLENRIEGLIDGATESLDVAMYLFSMTSMADRIIAAKNRGVSVRVLFDPDHDANTTVRSRLSQAGVPHRNAPSLYSFSHAKYLVIDGDTAVIMSNNFNADAMSRERNYGMVNKDPDDVADAAAIFAQDWAAGGGEPAMIADLACTRLVVSPNNAKVRILEHIDRATQRLDIEAIYISEQSVRDAIGAAKQRGVAVRVILESTTDNAEAIAYFRGLGIEVHSQVPFQNHAKLIISDGIAFVGSENFSQTALTRNREMGALVFEPTPAAVIQQQFDSDWAATSN